MSEDALVAYAAEHPTPANDTVVEGLPSGTYWRFVDGEREPESPTTAAVAVDDGALLSYPILVPAVAPSPKPLGTAPSASRAGGSVLPFSASRECRVPSLRRLSLRQATRRLVSAHCRLGEVARHGHARRVVITHQSARAGGIHHAQYRVNVTVS